MKFVPSLDLSRMLFEEEIQPILAKEFPNLKYAAATSGMCSEILGLDDEVSMDHEWGPRVTIFLSEQDNVSYAKEVIKVFQKLFPAHFKGFDMMWRKSGVDVHNTKETILYHVWIATVADALGFCGGLKALPLQDLDWLKVSEQHLLEFTAGVVYRDDLGDLTRARGALAYYPDTVLRYLLMCEWNYVGSEWFPIGRIGTRGDALGLHLQVGKIVQHLMRIAFMVSRRYFPYKKWFGTSFKQLPIAAELEPMLLELLAEKNWRQVEEKIGAIAAVLLEVQNNLGISPRISMKVEQPDNNRHHIKYDFWQIGRELGEPFPPALKSLMENEVDWWSDRNFILWNEEVGKWSFFLQK